MRGTTKFFCDEAQSSCGIAVGPSDKRTKLLAINLIRKCTKPKPVQRHATTAYTPKEWLHAVLAAGAAEGTKKADARSV